MGPNVLVMRRRWLQHLLNILDTLSNESLQWSGPFSRKCSPPGLILYKYDKGNDRQDNSILLHNGEKGFVTGLEEFSAISHFFTKGRETIWEGILNKTQPFVKLNLHLDI